MTTVPNNAVQAREVAIKDLGKCDHAIRIKDAQGAYEIGLVRRTTGPGWLLHFDSWIASWSRASARTCPTSRPRWDSPLSGAYPAAGASPSSGPAGRSNG